MIKRNKFKKSFHQFNFFLLSLFLVVGCESDDTDEPGSGNDDPSANISSQEDSLGNLLIINKLLEQIYLYHGDEVLLKKIPALTTFKIYVPVNDNGLEKLKIWTMSGISDPLLPDSSSIYRSWDVELLNSTLDKDMVTWVIGGSESVNDVGELIINYPSIDATGSNVIYNVDMFLDDTSSMVITSLTPGFEGQKIGLDYGYYDLHYLFWFQSDERIDVSWGDNTEINDQNSVIINSNNPSRTVEIEPFYGSSIGRKGKIKIVNHTDDYLRIVFNDSTLIEFIEMESLPATGLSLLYPNGGNFIFTIPENYYTFNAKNIDTDQSQDSRSGIYVMELYEYIWDIYDGNSYSEISITNNSGEDLTIHDGITGDYLGLYIPSEATSLHTLPDSIESLIAKNLIQDQDAKLDEIVSTWRITDINPAFHITFDPISVQDGEVVMSDEIEFSWTIGTDNQNVSVQLLNTSFNPHSVITVIDSPITNYIYQYLDDTEESQFYTFRINSNSINGEEFGWQEISFQVDAVQSNGIQIFPMQNQLSLDSLNGGYENHTFDIRLEEVDSLASFYIELEFDPNVFHLDQDSIAMGDLFNACLDPIMIMNDDFNETGKLGINVSLIGDECGFIGGSGKLFTISLSVSDQLNVTESLIFINSNSSFRDRYNSVISISNIFINYPLTSRVVFN